MRLIDADALFELIKEHDYMLVIDILNSKDYGMFTSGIKEAIDLTPTVEPMQWISVKDKENRPEDGEQVWCYENGHYFTAYYDEVQETDYGLNPFGFYELNLNHGIDYEEEEEYIESYATHWMPLPEPPEGETE